MPRRKSKDEISEFSVNLTFPMEGLNEERAFGNQKPGTSADCLNVTAFDTETGRARGGMRSGSRRVFQDQAVGEYSIQDLAQLSTNDGSVTTDAGSAISPFVYSTLTNGFGLASGVDGVSYATANPLSGSVIECSCWDADGNLYIVLKNAATDFSVMASYTSAGVVRWSTSFKYSLGGSSRTCAGLAIIGARLFAAFYAPENGTTLFQYVSETAALVESFTATQLGVTNWVPATNTNNCLGVCGTLLGIEAVGALRFVILDTLVDVNKILVHDGTSNTSAFVKVISDGNAFFYVICANSLNHVKKINTNPDVVWSSTASGTPTSIAFDTTSGFLLTTRATTPSLRRLSLADGTSVSTSDPGAVTNWSDIDCDNKGFFTLWRNGVASNDVVGLNTTLDVFWGPRTLANATHRGSTVNKASAPRPIGGATALGTRQIRNLAVSNGVCVLFGPDGPQDVTDGDSFSAGAHVVSSAQSGMDMYYVDGSAYRYYSSATNSIETWAATAGAMPTDSKTNTARLICAWDTRVVLGNLIGDPSAYFMTRRGDPTDLDYAPTSVDEDMAVSGVLEGILNCLIPFNDDLMLFGLDHSIVQMTGNPAAGGRSDILSSEIGIAWGKAFCKDDNGRVFFMSSQCNVYMISGPNAYPQRISQGIDKRLESINLSTTAVRLVWDLARQGLCVFITPIDASAETTHYFWEERVAGWQPFQFADSYFNPMAALAYDADAPQDRALYFGGRDGYVRQFDAAVKDDDGLPIDWFVTLGPILTSDIDELKLMELQPVLGENSGPVVCKVYTGKTAESALASDPKMSMSWLAGRNTVSPVNRSGHAIYVLVEEPGWVGSDYQGFSMEVIRARLKTRGTVARRM